MLIILSVILINGCATNIVTTQTPARLTPASATYKDLVNLPESRGKIRISVYGFRDQTGQFKPTPASAFSTSVTQGGASMLVKALLDSQWFVPVEREGLQNLLTERKIIRAVEQQRTDIDAELPTLFPSNVILEGGIVSYDTNVRTGGLGARYFGIGGSGEYRTDQVTVALRAVDVRTGNIFSSVSTTKTVFSYALEAGVFKFLTFNRLLEAEGGFTRNEPAQLCVNEAIVAAVIHLIIDGIENGKWFLKNPEDYQSPIIQAYIQERNELLLSESIKPDSVLRETSSSAW
ncbi:MAG: curli production assembly/transport protein CsgG [Nitrosomonas sp.]|nr:curli production assembly/transport protein CsgG [Nitrosomonas sp.]MCW5619325.1 curli production assembly/transport protein CsgG [Nitrosomonas sp.]